MKYVVAVTEELTRHVIVEAANEHEAEDKVEREYTNGNIVLDYDDLADCNITCSGEATECQRELYDELEVENE